MDKTLEREVIIIIDKKLEEHFPKNSFIEMNMNMETVMRHSKKHGVQIEDNNVIMTSVSTSLSNIEKYLVPHPLNNNKGLVSEFESSQGEIERLKGIIKVHNVYFTLLGIAIAGGGVLTWLVKTIFKT